MFVWTPKEDGHTQPLTSHSMHWVSINNTTSWVQKISQEWLPTTAHRLLLLRSSWPSNTADRDIPLCTVMSPRFMGTWTTTSSASKGVTNACDSSRLDFTVRRLCYQYAASLLSCGGHLPTIEQVYSDSSVRRPACPAARPSQAQLTFWSIGRMHCRVS